MNKVFVDFEEQTRSSREKIKKIVDELDPTLSAPVEKSYSTILSTIEKLHNRLLNRVQEKEDITQKHLLSIHEAILPNGTLQERLICPLYFENKYGQDWLKKVADKMDENFAHHIVVNL